MKTTKEVRANREFPFCYKDGTTYVKLYDKYSCLTVRANTDRPFIMNIVFSEADYKKYQPDAEGIIEWEVWLKGKTKTGNPLPITEKIFNKGFEKAVELLREKI